MMQQLELRVFGLDDLEAVKKLIDETIEESYSEYPEEYRKHMRDDHHAKQRIFNEAREGYTLVLEYRGTIIGTGTLLRSNILGVFIHPSHQRKGFGTLIMQKLEEQAIVTGEHMLFLTATPISHRFFDAINYITLEEQYFTAGTDKKFRYYRMTKEVYENG